MRSPQQSAIVLYLENNPNDVLLLQTAASRWRACFRIHAVDEILPAKKYLLGFEPFSDRTKYPFPSLLLLDYSLNGATGADLLRWVRHRPKFKDLPIIMFSGSDRGRRIADCYRSGANCFLIKPSNYDGFKEIAKVFHKCFSGNSLDFEHLRSVAYYREPKSGPDK